MKILIIEDETYKLDKVRSYIALKFPESTTDTAASYTEGLTKLLTHQYDVSIIDMTIPSHSKTSTENGGRLRSFGGHEIARAIVRKSIGVPFIIFSQFSTFPDKDKTLSLDDLVAEISAFCGQLYLGTVFFDSVSAEWEEVLYSIIDRYKNGA